MSKTLLQMSGAVVDLLYTVDAVPAAGEEAIVRAFSMQAGGGYNAMFAAKRAGIDVLYGGAIGTGPFADIVDSRLTADAIPVLRQRDRRRDQGCCTVLIDKTGERTFIASDGAEGHASAADISQVTATPFEWMMLSGYSLHYGGSRQAICTYLKSSTEENLVFDPSPVIAALPSDVLSCALDRATWISANQTEATYLSGCDDPVLAAQSLAKNKPAHGGAVVRTGADGCVVASADQCRVISPYTVHAIDTNGAGDTHIGSFIARLVLGDNSFEAARYANVAAALSTTVFGPATAPLPSAVLELL